MPRLIRATRTIRVVRRVLEMRSHQKRDILDRHAVLRPAAPRNIIGYRRVPSSRRIPILARVQITLHIPSARGVVNMVFCRARAEQRARIELLREPHAIAHAVAHAAVKMILADELHQIGAAHMIAGIAERILYIEIVKPQLVGNRGIAVIRHTLGNPMVSANRLHIPHVVHIRNGDAVRLIRAEPFQQLAQPTHAFTRGMHVRQHQRDEILLADTTGDFRPVIIIAGIAMGRLQFDHRISTEHPLVHRDRLGRAHRDIALADPAFRENSAAGQRVRDNAVAAWVARQVDAHVAQFAAVMPRLVARIDGDEAFRVVAARTGIVVAGDHGRAVDSGGFSDKKRSTRHDSTVGRHRDGLAWAGADSLR